VPDDRPLNGETHLPLAKEAMHVIDVFDGLTAVGDDVAARA